MCNALERAISTESSRPLEGEGAYIVWKAQTVDNTDELGTDTFIVRVGKIAPRG